MAAAMDHLNVQENVAPKSISGLDRCLFLGFFFFLIRTDSPIWHHNFLLKRL